MRLRSNYPGRKACHGPGVRTLDDSNRFYSRVVTRRSRRQAGTDGPVYLRVNNSKNLPRVAAAGFAVPALAVDTLLPLEPVACSNAHASRVRLSCALPEHRYALAASKVSYAGQPFFSARSVSIAPGGSARDL